jgi:D-hydroxyproline dehydrogenase subunit beta
VSRQASPDVVVVGGGIVGTAAAAFLAEAGAQVTLVEQEGLASGASGANSGVIQHPFDHILATLYEETLALYRDLSAADLGFRLADEPTGLMYISRNEDAVRRVSASLADSFPQLAQQVVGEGALERLEPSLAAGLWACRASMGFAVHPGSSTYAYATRAERGGARVRLGRRATLDRAAEAVRGVVIDGQAVACGAVLVAAGPWTPELIDATGRWAPIRRSWGVVVETDLVDGPTHVLEEAEIAAAIGAAGSSAPAAGSSAPAAEAMARDVPFEDLADFSLVPLPGLATVGSTFLAHEPVPDEWRERILTRAAEFVPAVEDAPIRNTRACARPLSVDGRPIIGPVPGWRGLYVCSGHGSWGISTGPASARLVVDEMLGRAPEIPPELHVARFGAPPPPHHEDRAT